MPTVSILLPLKNAAPWIAETIRSIQHQTFEEWELIVINDFSEDNSIEIVKEIAQKDQRIILKNNEKKGIIPALQLALTFAKGKFIARMDADDLMPNNRLSNMVNEIKESSVKTIVTGKVKYFSDKEVSEGYLSYQNWLNERIDKNDHFLHIYRECVIASPNWIAYKEAIIDHNVFDQLIYPEDYDMVFQWYEKGFQIKTIDEVTLFWREHPLRTSRNSTIYNQSSFFELKTSRFIKNYQDKKIGVLGVNQKGKLVAKQLIENELEFSWYDLKFEQFQSPIYGITIGNPDRISCEILVLAIYPENRSGLEEWILKMGFEIGKSAFWF